MKSSISKKKIIFPIFTFSLISKLFLIFIFHIKLKFIKSIDNCPLFYDCYICSICANETNRECDCEWNSIDQSCQKKLIKGKTDDWYNAISSCDEPAESIYCASRSYDTDDFQENQIVININKDKNDKYGNNLIFCKYEFEDENMENSYDISINFAPEIKVVLKPKISFSYYFKEENQIKGNIEEITENYENSFTQVYSFVFLVILKDEYDVMPVSLTIIRSSSLRTRLLVSFLIGVIFLVIIFSIICCTTNYLNRRTREHLRLLRAQRDLQIIQPVDISNEVDQDELKKQNTEKLNKLFETKLAGHIYKKEYNQYGGGCSICLENFNKKSKVSITSCSHVFHYKCINEWLFKNILCPKCPNCNNEILKDNYDNTVNNINNINNEENVEEIYNGNNNDDVRTIQIKKKQNNNDNLNLKKTLDISSQNQMLDNAPSTGAKNNGTPNSKRKMINNKYKKEKKKK